MRIIASVLSVVILFIPYAFAGDDEDPWKNYDEKDPPKSFIPPWAEAPITDAEIKLPEAPRPMPAPAPNDMVIYLE